MNYSELKKKSFSELYKLYDSSDDDVIKNLIKKVVDDKPLDIDYTDRFKPYPGNYTTDFQEQIYNKEEFYTNQLFLDTMRIEDSCNKEFSIKPHQSFLKNFITKESPYKSLLIYHGVGVGKTCSGITIAENFRDNYSRKDKRIIILSSKNIQIGWKKTIYTPEKKSNQCSGETYTSTGATTSRDVNKLVKQYYELMAYQSFSNFVKRMIKKYNQRYPNLTLSECKQQWIHEYFSERLFIIDEVHNIRDDQGSEMRDAVKTIEEVLKYSNNMRLILLTATPMYNRASEIIWIVNMMLLNDKRPLIQKKDVFKNDELDEEKLDFLRDKFKGYVSYLRGENPIDFPLRLYPSQLLLRGNKIIRDYPKYNPNCIINKNNHPSKNLVGGVINDTIEFMELFGSRFLKRGLQELVYKKSIQNLIRSNPELNIDDRGDKNPILENVTLTQITNMVYPLEDKELYENIGKGIVDINELYGERGLMNCMKKMGQRYSYKQNIPPIFHKDHINEYSTKLSSILGLIEKSEGIIFIYTNYINSGIIPLRLLLEQNGYKSHGGKDILRYPEWKSSGDTLKMKSEPKSYDGLSRSQAGDSFTQATYMVIDGSTSKSELEDKLKIVNSSENKYGQKIKIILGTVVASEGLDFKRIRSVHILDPWPHLNRLEQIIGRAIRFCSHSDLDIKERNVMIYFHVATSYDTNETVDVSIYRYAEKKSIEVGKVETILKESAIDRYLYRHLNVILKEDIQNIRILPSYRSDEINVNLYDKEYSKVCSWNKVCDYNKNLNIPNNPTNSDTMFDQYSDTCIENMKKKIKLMFQEFFYYDIDTILGLLNEYGFNQDNMIYRALYEMINNKYMIHDKYGNSGTIKKYGIYYIFQPYVVDDDSIPTFYRQNLNPQGKKLLLLPSLDEKEEVCKCLPEYNIESIRKVYTCIDNYIDIFEQKYEGISCLDNLSEDKPQIDYILTNLSKVYTDFKRKEYTELDYYKYHPIILGYLFDRLGFDDKCALLYGWFMNYKFKYDFYDDLQELLKSFIIYKKEMNDGRIYHLNGSNESGEKFGFVLSYNMKPCFHEFYKNKFVPCNEVQLLTMERSIKIYKKMEHFKQFEKTNKVWGYTISRIKKYNEEVVLKFVQPNSRGASEKTRYPPGPGNVCIENNRPARLDNLLKLIMNTYPELEDVVNDSKIVNKKDITCLLEFIFRYNKNSFINYDKIWLKYY